MQTLQDLDDTHLVIKADEENRVRMDLEAEVRSLFMTEQTFDPRIAW